MSVLKMPQAPRFLARTYEALIFVKFRLLVESGYAEEL